MHEQNVITQPTSSGFLLAVMISGKLISGATDNPAPWKEITLFSPTSLSTWRYAIESNEQKQH